MSFVFWLKRLPWGEIIRGVKEAAPAAMDLVREWRTSRQEKPAQGSDPVQHLEQRLADLELFVERQQQSQQLLAADLQEMRHRLQRLRRLVVVTLCLAMAALTVGLVALFR